MQRLIEESKILTLILFNNEADRGEFQALDVKIAEDIFRSLHDRFFTLVLGEINISDLQL